MDRRPLPHAASPAYPSRRAAWALGLLSLGGLTMAGASLTSCAAHRAAQVACPGDMTGPEPEPVEAPPEEPAVDGDMVPVEPEHLDGEMPAPAEDDEPEPQADTSQDAPVDPDEARIPGGITAPLQPIGEAPEPVDEGDGED